MGISNRIKGLQNLPIPWAMMREHLIFVDFG